MPQLAESLSMNRQLPGPNSVLSCENHPMSDKNLQSEFLRERYGVKPGRWKYVALFIAVIAIPWLLWTAWVHSNPESRTSLISFKAVDDRAISITFALTRKNPDTEFICTLLARDIDKNVVGEIDLLVPAGVKNQKVTAQIPTRLPAVNAGVVECRPRQSD